MKSQVSRIPNSAVRWLTVLALVLGIAGVVGCDARTWSGGGNRVEALNDATKRVIETLKTIQNEETAKQNQTKLEELAAEIKEIRQGIADAGAKSGGSGGGVVANYRPWQFQEQMEANVRSQLERIRESSKEAGDIVDKALEGSQL